LICVEGFSTLLNAAKEEGKLQGITICANAPSITHFLFVDDSLLFLKVDEDNVNYLQHILHLYEECSGQAINKDKSAVMFSQNTRGDARQKKKFGRVWSCLMRLALIWKQIEGWKDKLLSRAVKDILIKAVA
jgi:hypothetical protein